MIPSTDTDGPVIRAWLLRDGWLLVRSVVLDRVVVLYRPGWPVPCAVALQPALVGYSTEELQHMQGMSKEDLETVHRTKEVFAERPRWAALQGGLFGEALGAESPLARVDPALVWPRIVSGGRDG